MDAKGFTIRSAIEKGRASIFGTDAVVGIVVQYPNVDIKRRLGPVVFQYNSSMRPVHPAAGDVWTFGRGASQKRTQACARLYLCPGGPINLLIDFHRP